VSAEQIAVPLRLSRAELAERVAEQIPDGSWVNLGIGMPTLIAEVPTGDREVVFHCENGMVGMGPRADQDAIDWDLVNAGKEPVTLVPGGSFMNHAESFAMIRGRHLDLAILGAFQVAANGDLANWTTPDDGIPAVGGAMDLAVGARQVWVMTNMLARDGKPKLVEKCDLPLTAPGVVRRVFTDVAMLSIDQGQVFVDEIFAGLSFADVQAMTPVPLQRR
jgi:3-oxoadipate CoA-transferase beta subunit